MDIQTLKKDFPLFNSTSQAGAKVFFLDNAATTQKPYQVLDAMSNYYVSACANIGRGIYPLAEEATNLYESARKTVATFIGALQAETIFTSGTTAAINFVVDSFARHQLRAGDQILLTRVEHHANLLPWQRVAAQTGAQLAFVPFDAEKLMCRLDDFVLPAQTKFLAITLDSNVLGGVWGSNLDSLKSLIRRVKQQGGFVLLDAAQAIAHYSIDVVDFGTDFLCFSGHKLYGPTGVGVLYINKALHSIVQPYQVGGSMIASASFEDASWTEAPHKFEAGTPPVASAIGLAAAINYLKTYVDFLALARHETALCRRFIDRLRALVPQAVILYDPARASNERHLVSFYIPGIHAHDLADYVGRQGVALRAGNLCAQPLAQLLGDNALVRLSVALYNTPEDIDACVSALQQAVAFFCRI